MITLLSFPVASNAAVYEPNETIYSDAYMLVNLDDDSYPVVAQKNQDMLKYPASLTKIVTAIVTIEKEPDLSREVTVSRNAIESLYGTGAQVAGLEIGDTITIEQLLYLTMVHSACDACQVLAEAVSGSVEAFVQEMNDWAASVGCENTHFVNPDGLHDENHYTTANDLALIARYCMQNSKFRDIVSMKTCTINSTNKFGIRKYTNTNDLINPSSKYYLEECVGIKTGYTAQAKNCLISACSKNNIGLICVVLGANQLHNGESSRYQDSINLFKYGYSNYSIKTFANKDDVVKTIEVKNGSKDTRNLDLKLENDLSGLTKNNDEIPEATITLNDNISAPIATGAVLGSITYKIGENSYTENLVASHDVEQDAFLLLVFKIILGIAIFVILITILF